ncbi:SAM-dependent methyltransferase [Hydrogenophaga soli]
MSTDHKGTLYLVPTPLDFGCDASVWASIEDVLPKGTLHITSQLRHWITENAKSTRAFLKRTDRAIPLVCPIQDLDIRELPRTMHKKGDFGSRPVNPDDLRQLLAPALTGSNIGLVSEAGMPAVADPGALVVRMAHQLSIRVEVLVGPTSLIMALAASGLNGQNFCFVGYLPQSPTERAQRIRELENKAIQTGQTQVFIETPFRNEALLTSLVSVLRPTTHLAVSMGLTLAIPPESTHQTHHSAPVSHWRQHPPKTPWAYPAVFAIGI